MSEKQSLNFVIGNTIYIHGEFDTSIITDVIPYFNNLIEKEKNNKNAKITFSINSNGGFTTYVRSLLSYVEKAKSQGIIIETYVDDRAYSCASILAISGSKGHRYITSWGEHLVHYGGSGNVRGFTEIDFDRTAKRLKNHKKRNQEIYMYYTNLTLNQIKKLEEQDSAFLYAHECIKYGLADKIFGDENMLKQVSLNILEN